MTFTNIGEEYASKTALDGDTVAVGLYDSSSDTVTETDDLSAIDTEPQGSAYARQSVTLSGEARSGDWANVSAAEVTFDISDSSGNFDAYFFVVNFTSSVAGDGSASDHLLSAAPLGKTYNAEDLAKIDLNAGEIGVVYT